MKLKLIILLVIVGSLFSFVFQAGNFLSNLSASIVPDHEKPTQGKIIVEFQGSAWQAKSSIHVEVGSMEYTGNALTYFGTINKEGEDYVVVMNNGFRSTLKGNKVTLEIPLDEKQRKLSKFVTVYSRTVKGQSSNKLATPIL